MKKTMLSLIFVFVILFTMASPAFAAEGQPPIAGCPTKFELHMLHDMHHHEHHIGLKTDLNGDGRICVKHTVSGFHVHVDNVVK